MRILLDECVDQRLRLAFAAHDCQTAGYAKLAGLENGALLDAAEGAGFNVLVTTDQAIPHQQNLVGRQIGIVILCASTNRLAELQKLVPAALAALGALVPGEVVRIE
jgi:hypothetical protein